MVTKCECDCEENLNKNNESMVSYIEKEFAPIKVYMLQYCCPRCGIRQESKKNTEKGVGFHKWAKQIIKKFKGG